MERSRLNSTKALDLLEAPSQQSNGAHPSQGIRSGDRRLRKGRPRNGVEVMATGRLE